MPHSPRTTRSANRKRQNRPKTTQKRGNYGELSEEKGEQFEEMEQQNNTKIDARECGKLQAQIFYKYMKYPPKSVESGFGL